MSRRSNWTTKNDDGVWCNFCGELLIPPLKDFNSEYPECCPTCGAPDEIKPDVFDDTFDPESEENCL